jgi:hypothetical protein
MTSTLAPSPRSGGKRMPDHSGIRLPVIAPRFVPATLRPTASAAHGRRPAGAPPVRTA